LNDRKTSTAQLNDRKIERQEVVDGPANRYDNWGSTEGGLATQIHCEPSVCSFSLCFITLLIFLNNYRYHDNTRGSTWPTHPCTHATRHPTPTWATHAHHPGPRMTIYANSMATMTTVQPPHPHDDSTAITTVAPNCDNDINQVNTKSPRSVKAATVAGARDATRLKPQVCFFKSSIYIIRYYYVVS
jgi:hypothetical protein